MNKKENPSKSDPIELSRWTISIPWETRTAVLKAATRQKTPLNQWINKALLSASRETLIEKQEIDKPDDGIDVIKQIGEKIDKLSDEVNKPWWQRITK